MFIGLVFAMLASCTSARWTVKEKAAIDQSDYQILQQKNFLVVSEDVTPENPVLKLDVFSKKEYEYSQRVLMQRNIQEYRLRPGFVALGVAGSAMAFYLANSNSFGNMSSAKSWTLNAAGALFLASGFLNMKPVEEPRPTGEERYLRSTGTTTAVDTVNADKDFSALASVAVKHNGELVFTEEQRTFTGTLEIPLGNEIEDLELAGPDPGKINIEVTFKDSTYNYSYPVSQILQPYARVTAKLTELRNSPNEDTDNILADLVRGSRLKIDNADDKQWYRVLYGISENYIRKEDAELIWRSTGFVQDSDIVTLPRVPFGNIDVESNIPILRGSSPNSIALIVTNENYAGDLQERDYAHRDGRLIRAYLKNALGYPEQNIYSLQDVSASNELFRTLSEMRFAANDSTELFVYLNGYGTVSNRGDSPQLHLLGVAGNGQNAEISLSKLYEQLATLTASKTIVLNDMDFSRSVASNQFTANEAQRIIELNTSPLSEHENVSVLMGTQLTYPSSLYVSSDGEDKKHHIFPYFFAKALQQRRTKISAIYQYLERNISYTARRLYDRPQDPLLLGNSTIDLISE